MSRRLFHSLVATLLVAGGLVAAVAPAQATSYLTGTVPAPVVHDIAVGVGFACTRTAGGSVTCWGPAGGSVVTDAGAISGATQIASGDDFACALISTGHVNCWGSNAAGQVSGATSITNATQIAAAGTSACARLSDGSVSCWGNDADGIASGTRPTSGLTRVAMTNHTACALSAAGSVTCWGLNASVFANQMAGKTISSITMTGADLCATITDGSLECDTVMNGSIYPLPFITMSTAVGFAAPADRICRLVPGATIDCMQNGYYTDFAAHTNPLEMVSNGSTLCWVDASLTPQCRDFTTSATVLAPPVGTATALSAPATPASVSLARGFNRVRVDVTPASGATNVFYAATQDVYSGPSFNTCATTGTSCIVYSTQGSPAKIALSPVSDAGVGPATILDDYNVGAANPTSPQPPGLSGPTLIIRPPAGKNTGVGQLPRALSDITLTSAALAPLAPISSNLDLEVRAADGTPVTDLTNLAPTVRMAQPYDSGLPCDPVQPPADTTACPQVSDVYQFAWDGTVNGSYLPLGTYTVYSRPTGTSDPFTPVAGANTLTIDNSSPTGADWYYTTTANTYTFTGPGALYFGFSPVHVGGFVTAACAVDILDSNNNVVQHWDVSGSSGYFLTSQQLAVGDYTIRVVMTNSDGTATATSAVHVMHDVATGALLYTGTTIEYPLSGIGVDFHVVPQTVAGSGSAAPGELDLSYNGAVAVRLPLSGSAEWVHWDGLVDGKEVLGDFSAVATYPGTNGSVSSNAVTVTAAPETVTAAGIIPSTKTVYPFHDGYADSVTFGTGLTINGPGSMPYTSEVTVTHNGTQVFKAAAPYPTDSVTWNGLVGGKLIAGTYVATLTAKGPENDTNSVSVTITVSAKRLFLMHYAKKATPKSVLLGCIYAGSASCKAGSAVVGGHKVATFNYTVGAHKNKDALIAFHQMHLPSAVKFKRWAISLVGKSTSNDFGIVYCNDDQTFDTSTCSLGLRFSTKKQGTTSKPLVGAWTTRGMTDKLADFYVIGSSKGTVSVASFTLVLDYYVLR